MATAARAHRRGHPTNRQIGRAVTTRAPAPSRSRFPLESMCSSSHPQTEACHRSLAEEETSECGAGPTRRSNSAHNAGLSADRVNRSLSCSVSAQVLRGRSRDPLHRRRRWSYEGSVALPRKPIMSETSAAPHVDYYFTMMSPWAYIGHAVFAGIAETPRRPGPLSPDPALDRLPRLGWGAAGETPPSPTTLPHDGIATLARAAAARVPSRAPVLALRCEPCGSDRRGARGLRP